MKPLGFITSVIFAILLTGACTRTDRETQLRDTIHAMAGALEAHQADTFLDHVADDFTGNGSAWNARRVKRFVLGHALRKEPVSITLGEMEITLHGDRATAEVEARITGNEHWWPERGAGYRFDTGWRLEDGEWRVIRADWRRL